MVYYQSYERRMAQERSNVRVTLANASGKDANETVEDGVEWQLPFCPESVLDERSRNHFTPWTKMHVCFSYVFLKLLV